MAYYLKKTKLKGRTYLSIDESFYDQEKRGTAHKCFRSLGSVETWIKKGVSDPIAYFQKEVDALNQKKAEDRICKITEHSPVRYLGYFPFQALLEKMCIPKYVNYFEDTNVFDYDLYELLSSLIYARAVYSHSDREYKTFHELLPNLYTPVHYSYEQLLNGLAFLGENYEKFVAFFTGQTKRMFKLDMSNTYFASTTFYFVMDRDFQREKDGKKDRKEPILSLGFLLDNNQIPIGIKMYPEDVSEKSVLKEMIHPLKAQNNITGRTIYVTDQRLYDAKNLIILKRNGDGYLFSRPILELSETEKTGLLPNNAFIDGRDKNGTLLYRYLSNVDEFPYKVEHEGKEYAIRLLEKRLRMYIPSLAAEKRYEINRRIEKAKALTAVKAKRSEYGESGKYVNFTNKVKNKHAVPIDINQYAINKDLQFAGYHLFVTSEIERNDSDIYHIINQLWKIEESFKSMKSDLDICPMFLQKEDIIKGCFLISYLTILLERLFQVKVLENEYHASEITAWLKDFKVIKGENNYINITKSTDAICEWTEKSKMPLTNYFLTETQIKSILKYKF